MVVVIIALGAMLTDPGIGRRETPMRVRCAQRIRMLMAALEQYRTRHGDLPPGMGDSMADPEEAARVSWRVWILPDLDMQRLFDEYDLTEDWDSPTNSSLEAYSNRAFCCPALCADRANSYTSYFALKRSREADLPRPPGRDANQVTNAILLIEVDRLAVHWMEPRDLDVEQFLQLWKERWTSPLSPHDGGTHVVLMNGDIRFLSYETTVDELMTMLPGGYE